MVKEHTYQLPKTSKKFTCPSCGEKKQFKRYVNIQTMEILGDHVGKCERINSCKYHYTPRQFFAESKGSYTRFPFPTPKGKETGNPKPLAFLPFEVLDRSVLSCFRCNLFPYLSALFSKQAAERLCKDHLIGSSRMGNTAFWQVDINLNVRQVKVMPYKADGHRDKDKVIKEWVDKETGELRQIKGAYAAGKEILRRLNQTNVHLESCFFGEHLLADEDNGNKPVAIVESEKTAAIASIYEPTFTWLATGGKSGVKWTERNVCKVLAGREVILYPDLGAFDTWKQKGNLLAAVAGCKVRVSDLLERYANHEQRNQGLDIADFLIKRDAGWAVNSFGYPIFWDL